MNGERNGIRERSAAFGQRRRRAVSLIEVAVLGVLLVGLLAVVPVTTRRVRGDANLTGCLANLKAIGAASLTYAAEDPSELMIPVPALEPLPDRIGAFEWGGKAGRGQQTSPGQTYTSIWGTGAWRGPAHRPLNPYLYPGGFPDWNQINGTPQPGAGHINWINDANLDLAYYRCPSDTGYAGGGFLYTVSRPDLNERAFKLEGYTAYDHYGTSYAAPVHYVTGGLLGSQVRSMGLYLTPLSQVADPAHTLAYQEVPSRFVWIWGSWAASGCDYSNYVEGNGSIVPGWHGTPFHFNATFADGHSATIEMKGTFRPAPNIGNLTYPANQCGEGYSGYACLRCVIHRGPGWQLDTLPAEPILTPWFANRSSPGPQEAMP